MTETCCKNGFWIIVVSEKNYHLLEISLHLIRMGADIHEHVVQAIVHKEFEGVVNQGGVCKREQALCSSSGSSRAREIGHRAITGRSEGEEAYPGTVSGQWEEAVLVGVGKDLWTAQLVSHDSPYPLRRSKNSLCFKLTAPLPWTIRHGTSS